MSTAWFLMATAIIEVGTGLSLLLFPAVPMALLLGIAEAAPETLLIGRVAGAALFALGVVSGTSRTAAQQGILAALLIYDTSAAALLAHAGLALNLAGAALWPAVVLHTLMAGWCTLCISGKGRDRT